MSQIINNRRSRAIRRGIAVVLVLVVGPAAWLIYDNTRDRSPAVRTARIATGNITSVMSINTTIMPGSIQKTSVSRQMVKEVLVKPGDQVKQGDTLITFDLTEFKDQLATASDARKQTEAAASKASAMVTSQANSSKTALQNLQSQVNKLSSGLSGVTSAISKLTSTAPAHVSLQEGLTVKISEQLALIDPEAPDAPQKIQAVLDTMLAGVQISPNLDYQQQITLLNTNVGKMQTSITSLLGSLVSTGLVSSASGSSMTSQIGDLVKTAQTAVAQATQAEKLAQQALDGSIETIKAEMDGVIAQVNAVAGEYAGTAVSSSSGSTLQSLLGGSASSSLSSLSTTQTPVIVLYDNTRPMAYFQANRLDSKKLEVGMPVKYTQDDQTWSGQITYKSSIANNSSLGSSSSSSSGLLGSVSQASGLTADPLINLEMSIEGEQLIDLTLGFTLDAEIATASAENVLLLPAEAMKKELGEYYVFVLGADSRLVRRTFTPGIMSDLFSEVLEGLSAGDKVILNPSNDLAEGMLVKENTNE